MNRKNWSDVINAPNTKFCDGVGARKKVVDLLCGSIFSPELKPVLLERYEKMALNFKDVPWSDARWNQGSFKNEQVSPKDKTCAVLDVYGNQILGNMPINGLVRDYYNAGHDLPVWVSRSKSKRRIMIVGQDPLRNGHPDRGHLYISSPWALHHFHSSSGGLTKTRNVIASLILEYDADVYMTDFSKLYYSRRAMYRKNEVATPNFLSRTREEDVCLQECHKIGLLEIFRKEISIVKPNKIFVFGASICNLLGIPRYEVLPSLHAPTLFDGVRIIGLKHPNARGITYDYYRSAFDCSFRN